MLTAGPTLLACLALYFLGGEVLNGIAFALLTGIVVGTYSSIFVASALLVFWRERTELARKNEWSGSPASRGTQEVACARDAAGCYAGREWSGHGSRPFRSERDTMPCWRFLRFLHS